MLFLSQGFAEEGCSMGYCSGSVSDHQGRGKRRDMHKFQTRFLEDETTGDHCSEKVRTIWSSVQGWADPMSQE